MPGYSFSSPRFTTIGNVSKYFLEDKVNPSLLGLGVQSIDLIHKFLGDTNNIEITYFADDFESNLALLYKIIRDNYSKIVSNNFSMNLDEFLNIKKPTTLPAILFLDNLHEIFLIIKKLNIKKYNFELNSKTNFEKYVFSN